MKAACTIKYPGVVFTLAVLGGQRSACCMFPGVESRFKGKNVVEQQFKSGAGGVTESYGRLTDVHSALSTISTLCVLCKASTLDSHTLRDASYTQHESKMLNTRRETRLRYFSV